MALGHTSGPMRPPGAAKSMRRAITKSAIEIASTTNVRQRPARARGESRAARPRARHFFAMVWAAIFFIWSRSSCMIFAASFSGK
jgi:hypothetical protein